ncbi:MAG TPA: BPSS1780 family membrane protein [Ramlibacter sp.]|nr:BPSS1780 family membrane protein [Ramlibacter sp.]
MKLNIVPARTGLHWIRIGIRTFFRQPLALAGLFFMYMTVVIAIAQVPYVGIFIGGLVVPAATLGLMAASEEATKGRFPLPTVLLSAFRAGRQRARAMLTLGVIYTACSWLATTIAALATSDPAPGTALDSGTLLALVLHIPIFMMFWHAPALVHWHGVSPAKSLFFSLVACLRNFGAFFVYTIGWLLVFMVVGTFFGIVGMLIGGSSVARAIMMPVALLLAAMFSTSIYFTFRDCFLVTEETPVPKVQELS